MTSTSWGEVTRISDVDGDGIADRYDTLTSNWGYAEGHEFAFASKHDPEGNIWVALGLSGSYESHNLFRGWAVKVTPASRTRRCSCWIFLRLSRCRRARNAARTRREDEHLAHKVSRLFQRSVVRILRQLSLLDPQRRLIPLQLHFRWNLRGGFRERSSRRFPLRRRGSTPRCRWSVANRFHL